MKLKNKVAIITGASGIGRCIAVRFARESAKVAIADLKLKAADAAVSERSALPKVSRWTSATKRPSTTGVRPHDLSN
jgi:NAD(P)-dependent dehydrogenase (short-subunit alcohol dehydrogenase family)